MVKEEKIQEDWSERVNTEIPKWTEVAKKQNLSTAVEGLLALEKHTRQSADVHSTTKLAEAIIQLCYEANDFNILNDVLVTISKRRGQLKTVIQRSVAAVMELLEKISHDEKMRLLFTLREVTDGKIFVEVERARLTQILAKVREDQGDINEAAKILNEIQVETFGQMDRLEKTAYLLEQLRLTLKKNDFVRGKIISNKIMRKVLNQPEFQELKLKFYDLMITYHEHENQHLDMARCYFEMYGTPLVEKDTQRWRLYLKHIIVHLALSPYDNEQSDFLARIYQDKKTEDLPAFRTLLKALLTAEIVQWNGLRGTYEAELSPLRPFANPAVWITFRNRVVEHNIRTIAKYYTRISVDRLSELLSLSVEETEKFVSAQVIEHVIYARIDRPARVITFQKPQDPNDLLNDWAENVNKLLALTETNTQTISKILTGVAN